MKTAFFYTTFIFLLFCNVTAQAQIDFTNTSVSYAQNFDSLANTGVNIPWTDNTTVEGWYSDRTTYNADNGTSFTGSQYSYGMTSSTERALGSLVSGGTGNIFFGVRLRNNDSSFTIDSITVSYVGEQWRIGTTTNPSFQTLTFSYMISDTAIGDIDTGTYTAVPGLDFTGPQDGSSGSVGPIDGNLPQNRTAISDTLLSISIPPGSEIMLRWQDTNDFDNDHGLAIDSVVITVHYNVPIVGVKTVAFSNSIQMKLVPNPATEQVNVYWESPAVKGAHLRIVNAMGVVVHDAVLPAQHRNTIPISNLPAGMYMVEIQEGQETIRQKLLKL